MNRLEATRAHIKSLAEDYMNHGNELTHGEAIEINKAFEKLEHCSQWIGVVEHGVYSGERIGEALINLDNVEYISVAQNKVYFVDHSCISINTESMKVLLDVIETM